MAVESSTQWCYPAAWCGAGAGLSTVCCVFISRHAVNIRLPIVLKTFAFLSAHNSLANERTALAGDHSALSFSVRAIVVEYHPVSGFAHLVGAQPCWKTSPCSAARLCLNAGSAATLHDSGLKRRGAMVGKAPAAALSRYSRSTSRISAMAGVGGLVRGSDRAHSAEPCRKGIDNPGDSFVADAGDRS